MWFRGHISTLSVVAGVAWVIGGIVLILGVILQREGVPAIGLYISMWGGTMTLARCYERHAASREEAAFELGRRVGSHDNVRQL